MVRRQENGAYADAESIRRYDPESGAYVDAGSGKAQKEGVWEEVWPVKPKKLYLYNRGDECIDVTGGWEKKDYSNKGGAITVSKEADCLKLRSNAGSTVWNNAGFNTVKEIGLSSYSTLNAKITINRTNGTSDASTQLAVAPEITSDIEHGLLAQDGRYEDATEYILSADISKVTESQVYVTCYMHSGMKPGAQHYVYEIWLE